MILHHPILLVAEYFMCKWAIQNIKQASNLLLWILEHVADKTKCVSLELKLYVNLKVVTLAK